MSWLSLRDVDMQDQNLFDVILPMSQAMDVRILYFVKYAYIFCTFLFWKKEKPSLLSRALVLMTYSLVL